MMMMVVCVCGEDTPSSSMCAARVRFESAEGVVPLLLPPGKTVVGVEVEVTHDRRILLRVIGPLPALLRHEDGTEPCQVAAGSEKVVTERDIIKVAACAVQPLAPVTSGSRTTRPRPDVEEGHPPPPLLPSSSCSPPSSPSPASRPRLESQTTLTGFHLREVRGDLFQNETSSLAHCVSEDLHMNKGIALGFHSRFGGVAELRAQGPRTGGMVFLTRGARRIFYLVTKERYFHKPTYETLRSSLEAMRDKCVELNVQELALPKIGSGLDRLQWERVRDLIKEVFKTTGVHITVYTL